MQRSCIIFIVGWHWTLSVLRCAAGSISLPANFGLKIVELLHVDIPPEVDLSVGEAWLQLWKHNQSAFLNHSTPIADCIVVIYLPTWRETYGAELSKYTCNELIWPSIGCCTSFRFGGMTKISLAWRIYTFSRPEKLDGQIDSWWRTKIAVLMFTNWKLLISQ